MLGQSKWYHKNATSAEENNLHQFITDHIPDDVERNVFTFSVHTAGDFSSKVFRNIYQNLVKSLANPTQKFNSTTDQPIQFWKRWQNDLLQGKLDFLHLHSQGPMDHH